MSAQHPAVTLLDAIARLQHGFVVLHREEEIARGIVHSDVDVAVTISSLTLTQELVVALAGELRCIGVWPYDVETTTSFWIAPDGTSTQLDICGDVCGSGKYGFRTPALIAASVVGDRWPRLAPLDGLLYEARKRMVKRDANAWDEALERIRPVDDSVLERVRSVFAPNPATELCIALASSRLPRVQRNAKRLHWRRFLGRAVHPIGSWIHCVDDDAGTAATQVLSALRPALVHTRCEPHPMRFAPAVRWYVRTVAPIRWRPGLMISYGQGSRLPGLSPDAIIGPTAPDPVGAALQVLETRALALLSLSTGALVGLRRDVVAE